ncbi:Uncharacterised protein [Mycobacteroides abscessus subsp. abscessus]|nr:Uncharacterised protein [Mycobacteroides abscessus subsp. abscessus]
MLETASITDPRYVGNSALRAGTRTYDNCATVVRFPSSCAMLSELSAITASVVASGPGTRSISVRKPLSIRATPFRERFRPCVVTARPLFISANEDNVTRLFFRMLTVSGSTESNVDSRNTPPSMMSVILRGASRERCSSFLMISSFFVSAWASAPSASASNLDSDTGTVACPRVITLPLLRYGPAVVTGAKSTYCSPAGESPDTRTGVPTGIFTPDSI